LYLRGTFANVSAQKKPAINGLLESYPARTPPTAENTGVFEPGTATTPKTTPQPAVLVAKCMQQHLDAEQLTELMRDLQAATT